MPRLLLAFLALPFLLAVSDAALAQKRIGVRDLAVEGDTSSLPAGYGRRLSEMLVTEMTALLASDPQFQGCNATVELTGATEPGSGPGMPTHLVEGKVEVAGPDADYEIAARSASGPLAAADGRFAAADPASFPAPAVALALLKSICEEVEAAARASRIELHFNDLSIDQVVCDLHKPFKLSGLGATRNIHYTLTPTGRDGGEWTMAGTAAGVTWSGEGVYTFPMMQDGFGVIQLVGAWRLKSPMGIFGTSDTMPGTVSPDDGACRQMY